MDKNTLKQVIANNEMDVLIVREEFSEITAWLQEDGYVVTLEQVTEATKELRADPYYTRLVESGFGRIR